MCLPCFFICSERLFHYFFCFQDLACFLPSFEIYIQFFCVPIPFPNNFSFLFFPFFSFFSHLVFYLSLYSFSSLIQSLCFSYMVLSFFFNISPLSLFFVFYSFYLSLYIFSSQSSFFIILFLPALSVRCAEVAWQCDSPLPLKLLPNVSVATSRICWSKQFRLFL